MIKLRKSGVYTLIETHRQIKILYLDTTAFVWLFVPGIGQILERTAMKHQPDHILAIGKYRLYDVANEPKFSAHKHLELFVGEGRWQSYFLLTDLPNSRRKRTRLIPTDETITNRAHYALYKDIA